MNETLLLILAGAAGMGLGAIFFGGLWWTVRRALWSPRPATWFLGSALVRTGVALAGFYLVGGGEWRRLVACLIGFIVARLLVTVLTRTPANAVSPTAVPHRTPARFHPPPANPQKK